jgi:hypothetical protein
VAIVATSMGMLNKLNDVLRVPLEVEFERSWRDLGRRRVGLS